MAAENMFNIEEELKKLPSSPGVYLMHDGRDDIIYVGKAVNLRNRVRQYFRKSTNKTLKIEQMVSHIVRFEYIVTDSELEALILECNLIKQYRPKYNTMLMDDKTYPYVKVTVDEDYPRILFTREMKRDKCKYYGPFTSATAVKDTIELVQKLYNIRNCNRNLPRDIGRDRPCLNYHIGQCSCPCMGKITKEQYAESIKAAMRFLDGDYEGAIKNLQIKMENAAENLEFEEAAKYRDLINSIHHVAGRQKITTYQFEDRDIIGYASEGYEAVVQVFFVRGGKLIGREHFYLTTTPGDTGSDIVTSFIKQYYDSTPYVPRELFTGEEVADADLIERWLSKTHGFRVHIITPKKGNKQKLVELATRNAGILLEQDREKFKREKQRTTDAVGEIGGIIGVENISRIEAYDISNISGYQSVGSMVVYEDGKPKRNSYRKFKIKTIKGADDYHSLEEVLTRRFAHGIEERNTERSDMGSFSRFPDLIMMDGGKGQVNIALGVLEKFNLDIPVCGMVKDDNHRTRGLYYNNKEMPIDTSSEGFKLITRIQDEAHRFAIEYHRSLRAKGQVRSVLDDIDGIGPKRRKALMREFKTIEAVKEADIEKLKSVPGMNEAAASAVYAFFH